MSVLFTLWGYDVTVIEFLSVILAFIAIGLGIRGLCWTWPLLPVQPALRLAVLAGPSFRLGRHAADLHGRGDLGLVLLG